MKKGVNTWIGDKNDVANQSDWTLFWVLLKYVQCSKRVKYLLLNYKQCCSYQKYSTCHPSAPKTQSCDKTAKSYITLSKTLIRILSDTFELLTPRIEGVLLSDHFRKLEFLWFLVIPRTILSLALKRYK